MKKITSIVLLFLAFLLVCCGTRKNLPYNRLIKHGDLDTAIYNAICDYSRHLPTRKKNKGLAIQVYAREFAHYYGVDFDEPSFKVSYIVDKDGSVSYRGFPTNAVEIDGNLYYWDSSTTQTKIVTDSVIQLCYKYNHVDTFNEVLCIFPEYMINESQKGCHYYFRKKNLRRYLKFKSRFPLEYDVPYDSVYKM